MIIQHSPDNELMQYLFAGLTYDGTNLIVSDGSSYITTFAVPEKTDKRLSKV